MKELALVLAVAACTSSTTEPEDTFLAFNTSFVPFRTWPMFHSDGPIDDGTLPPGVAGPRDQFLNEVPPAGATVFPIGTIIVEVRTDTGKIFASVKRGGGFNAAGAKDWEYFELEENPVQYLWRGLGPPLGDTYGGDPDGCNTCHVQCAANDYICSPVLQLATLPR
jgi:hypothetical protein